MEGEVRLKSPCRINQPLVYDQRCIICQSSDTEDLKSTENSRRGVIGLQVRSWTSFGSD